MKYSKFLKNHKACVSLDPSYYVDYSLLKKAVRQNCTEEEFRALYQREALKFISHIEEGERADSQFVAVNLTALEKASKKFDKNAGLSKPVRMQTGLPPGSCPDRFQARLQRHLNTAAGVIQVRIEEAEERVERIFSELKGGSDEALLDEKALMQGLAGLDLPASPAHVRALLAAADKDRDGKVSFRDFKRFVLERERAIRDLFLQLNTSPDGYIYAEDLLKALRPMGIGATRSEVVELMVRTHAHKALAGDDDVATILHNRIDYATFREILVLLPAADDIESVFDYWQQAVDFEFGGAAEVGRTAGFLETFAAGGVAGAVSRTCTAPLDRLKLLTQTDITGRYSSIYRGLAAIYEDGKTHRPSSEPRGPRRVATGAAGAIAGGLAFFRGNGTNVAKIAPETAVKFWAYERAKGFVCKDPAAPTGLERFACGAAGGICAQSCVYPMEIVKTRLAVSRFGTYKGIAHCLFKIARQEGLVSLYKGLGASVLGIIPYSGVDMAVYFSLRERYKDSSVSGMLACGVVSSTCGMVCSFPLQLIRTRMQASGLEGMPVYDSILDCFKSTVKRDGVLGLYRGFQANMLKAVPAISITYMVYETVRGKLLNFRRAAEAST